MLVSFPLDSPLVRAPFAAPVGHCSASLVLWQDEDQTVRRAYAQTLLACVHDDDENLSCLHDWAFMHQLGLTSREVTMRLMAALAALLAQQGGGLLQAPAALEGGSGAGTAVSISEEGFRHFVVLHAGSWSSAEAPASLPGSRSQGALPGSCCWGGTSPSSPSFYQNPQFSLRVPAVTTLSIHLQVTAVCHPAEPPRCSKDPHLCSPTLPSCVHARCLNARSAFISPSSRPYMAWCICQPASLICCP